MALPTITECKSYLRIETSAEDTVVTSLLASALAWAEALIGRPIAAVARTLDGLMPRYDEYGRHQIFLPIWPVLTSGTPPVITDNDGNVVLNTTYTVDGRNGRLQTNAGVTFATSPFSVVATVGLSAHPDYATKYEPSVRALILGLVAILYKQRNPNASSDSSGGGVSVSYQMQNALPPYLEQIVGVLRGGRVRG